MKSGEESERTRPKGEPKGARAAPAPRRVEALPAAAAMAETPESGEGASNGVEMAEQPFCRLNAPAESCFFFLT